MVYYLGSLILDLIAVGQFPSSCLAQRPAWPWLHPALDQLLQYTDAGHQLAQGSSTLFLGRGVGSGPGFVKLMDVSGMVAYIGLWSESPVVSALMVTGIFGQHTF